MKPKILWDKKAAKYLEDAIKFIRKDSPVNAEKVKKEILQKIREAAERPETYPPDKYKRDNNSSYRAFEIHHYRISYLIKDKEIIIARIRHTAQNPLSF